MTSTLPAHVAIIMDGNGRWATARGKPRSEGHLAGAGTVRSITRHAAETGLKYLTLYAFSTENWSRPKEEVDALMELFSTFLKNETKSLLDNNIKLHIIGDVSALSENLRRDIQSSIDTTMSCTGLTLTIAINYGGRDEIIRAARQALRDIRDSGEDPGALTAERFGRCLDTRGCPDPDMIIRTAGEQRLSNFLVWQAAYAELYFSKKTWPEFGPGDFDEALADYAGRTRKFGGADG